MTSVWYSGLISLYHTLIRVFIAVHSQDLSVPKMGGQHCESQIWVGTSRNSSIVRLSHRRTDTARALAHVIATDAAHTGGAEWALHHSFSQTCILAL
jgi:hypothetical protein